MNFQKIIDDLLPVIGQAGVDLLTDTFQDLAAQQESPWAQAALALLGDAVGKYGLDGIDLARRAINNLFDDKVPDIDWASPRVASDFVAELQNAEADDKNAARDFFTKMGGLLEGLLEGIIRGLLASGATLPEPLNED